MICVVFAFISGLVILQTSQGKFVEAQAPTTIMQCIGSNLTLNEPDPKNTNLRVFRGDESLASTTAAATGRFRDRLIVSSEGRVSLENLSADDLGVYRVEVKLSDDRRIQRSLRLVVSEPPQTGNGTLGVKQIFSSGRNSVRLTCGNFKSLGFPPVSAVWEDPLGHVLPSDGFKDQTFYLDLPLDTAESGDYCCRLDCPAPTHCCLEERSPLRQCAQVHVQTRKAGATVKITDYVSLASFSRLRQQMQDLATDLEQTSALEGNVSTLWDVLTSHVTSTNQSLVDVRTELVNLRTTTDVLKAGICAMRKGVSWYGGRCLKFDTRTVDFQSARANCLTDGGHLLNIKSSDDARLLRDAVRVVGVTVPSPLSGVSLEIWVGATDIATEGTFVWGDGTALPVTSPLWYQGEPNDVVGQENCVEVYLDTTSMQLNDNRCTAQFHYVCEYD